VSGTCGAGNPGILLSSAQAVRTNGAGRSLPRNSSARLARFALRTSKDLAITRVPSKKTNRLPGTNGKDCTLMEQRRLGTAANSRPKFSLEFVFQGKQLSDGLEISFPIFGGINVNDGTRKCWIKGLNMESEQARIYFLPIVLEKLRKSGWVF
jgi:hypothetical protein